MKCCKIKVFLSKRQQLAIGSDIALSVGRKNGGLKGLIRYLLDELQNLIPPIGLTLGHDG